MNSGECEVPVGARAFLPAFPKQAKGTRALCFLSCGPVLNCRANGMRKRILSLRFIAAMVLALSVPPASHSARAMGAQISVRPEPAPERVLAGLRNNNASTRRETADQLGALRARNAVRPLIDTLRDKDAGVREAA